MGVRTWFPNLEVIEMLGAGGIGAVYTVRQLRLERTVLLKVLNCPLGQPADFAPRFELEARVMARLTHPHIVTIYDLGEIHR